MNMLFGYPIAATQNNWFHDCVYQTVQNIHVLVDANRRYPKWPGVLPEAHQNTLRRRDKLDELLKAYYAALRQLTKGDRDFVLGALESENRIPDLLSGTADCVRRSQLPLSVQVPIVQLFTYAFDILGGLDLRSPHY